MNSEAGPPVILFDGVCNLCESSVQLVIRSDSAGLFRFASLQSRAAQDILGQLNYQYDELSSVLLVQDGSVYRKSRAALKIARQMDGFWPVIYYLFIWIPRVIADPVYDFIGSRRYKWFGKKETCWVPDDELLGRFLSDGIT